jgi:hypothetical protein
LAERGIVNVADNSVPLVMRMTRKQDGVVSACKVDRPRVLLCFDSTQGYPDRGSKTLPRA